jgi:hypothetical protein
MQRSGEGVELLDEKTEEKISCRCPFKQKVKSERQRGLYRKLKTASFRVLYIRIKKCGARNFENFFNCVTQKKLTCIQNQKLILSCFNK